MAYLFGNSVANCLLQMRRLCIEECRARESTSDADVLYICLSNEL